MTNTSKPKNLSQMLEKLEENTTHKHAVSVQNMLEAIGRRSFGPILLLAGLIPASPLSGIPGLPSTAGIMAFIVIIQLLIGREYFWLPQWLLNREIARPQFDKVICWLKVPARWLDRFIYPRWGALTHGPAVYGVAILCACIAMMMFPLEFIPFANTISGTALALFGLALTVHDGLLVVIGAAVFILAIFMMLEAV